MGSPENCFLLIGILMGVALSGEALMSDQVPNPSDETHLTRNLFRPGKTEPEGEPDRPTVPAPPDTPDAHVDSDHPTVPAPPSAPGTDASSEETLPPPPGLPPEFLQETVHHHEARPTAAKPEPHKKRVVVHKKKASHHGHAHVHVPGYEIVKELGRGGMGVVYLAKQIKADRLVALKMILSQEHAGKEEVRRFCNESHAIARLHHAHIVQIYDVGEHDGRPYFSLEYCAGGTLVGLLNRGPLEPAKAAGLVRSLAKAMQAAHDKNVVHRDLKPANILFSHEGSPKITDFGLARRLDEASQTQSGAVMGTPSYMAPEQAGAKTDTIGPTTDVYALGAILYDCLTGRPPFRSATAMDTVMQVINHDPVAPRHLAPQTPHDLEVICLKCLQKDQSKRYQTAAELADDLRRFLHNEPISARPASMMEQVQKWVRRRPAIAGLLGGLALLMLLLIIGGIRYNILVQDQRDEALRQEKIAQEQSARATKILARVFQGADQLSRVNPDRPVVIPQILGDRQQQLEDALEFYRGFLNEKSENLTIQREIGRVYLRMAIIHHWLEKNADAKKEIDNALQAQRKLVKERPENAALRADLARSCLIEGHVHTRLDQNEEAKKAWERAQATIAPLVQKHPENPLYQMTFAESELYLAGFYHSPRKEWDPALKLFNKAKKTMEGQSERHSDQPDYAFLVAYAITGIGKVYQEKALHDQAAKQFEKSHQCLELIAKQHLKQKKEYRQVIAENYFSHGACRMKRGDAPEAVQAFRDSIKVFEQLMADYPNLPIFRERAALTWYLLAATHTPVNELAEGRLAYQKSLENYTQLAKEHPKNRQYREGQLLQLESSSAEVINAILKPVDALAWYDNGLSLVREIRVWSTTHDPSIQKQAECALQLLEAGQARSFARADDGVKAIQLTSQLYGQLDKLCPDAKFELARALLDYAGTLGVTERMQIAEAHQRAEKALLSAMEGELVRFGTAKSKKGLPKWIELEPIKDRPDIVALIKRLPE